MATNLNGINRSTTCGDCSECEGGIARFAVTDFCYVQDVTIDANRRITAIVMTADGAGKWADYVHDSDDTASLSQIPEKINFRTKRVNVTAFGKFSCVTASMEDEANNLMSCCTPVIAIEKNNGELKLIGIDVVSDGPGAYDWKRSKTEATILPSVLTGTGAEEDRIEVNMEAVHRKFAATFDGVDIDDLLAL